MPHEPKKRHSHQRQGKRRAAITLDLPQVGVCAHCGSVIRPHTICASCGFYRGKQFLHKRKVSSQKMQSVPQSKSNVAAKSKKSK